MKKAPPQKPRRNWKNSNLVVLLPMLGIGAAYVLLLFLPNYRQLNKQRELIQLQQDFIDKTEGLKGEISELQAQVSQTQDFCQQWLEKAPGDADIPQIHKRVSECVTRSGATVTGFDPQPALTLDTLDRIPLTVRAAGDFSQIHDMLARLEAMPETLWLENLRMQAGGKNAEQMNCEVNLVVFAKKSENSD